MATETTATVIATIFSTVIASAVSVLLGIYLNSKQQKKRLLDKISEINKLAIEYPYFENDTFCNDYSDEKGKSEEQYIRYESYCCLVFNVLEEYYNEYDGKLENIKKVLGIEEMVSMHREWWRSPRERGCNMEGYPLDFVFFIDDILKIPHLDLKRS